MKKIWITGVCFFVSQALFAQQRAVTSNGREVILNDNGTWKYAEEETDTVTTSAIPVNAAGFEKSKTATFLVKSSVADFGVYIDPKKWEFKKSNDPSAREYLFNHRAKDIYVMLLAERIEIPIDKFPEIALKNAQNAAPDAKVVRKEYRTVNGNKVLCMQMTGTTSGIKFAYFGYYFANDSGTLQLIGFTSQKLFKEYQAEIEDFLNGLVPISH